MAIYRLNTQPISRSQGRSVVACAAYRAGEKLEDLRYEKTHDYTKKQDVVHKEILLPENAPEWMRDRETLWNHVEEIEKRKDARLAREVQIALPRELTLEQNQELAREFVLETFVKKGMVADLCLHTHKGDDGLEQPHCHVLLSTRHVSEEGFGKKNTLWDKKEMLLEWREAWAGFANAHLAKHEYEIKIDHRSNKDREINLEPQRKVDIANSRYRDKQLENQQRIARENGERIYKNPEIALDAITKQQSTFTSHDLAKFINRHTLDAEQFHQVHERVKLADGLVKLGIDEQGKERFSTKEMITLEANMLSQADTLSNREKHRIDSAVVEDALVKRSLSNEQKEALRYITHAGDLKCVLGYAGTGKSYMLSCAREVWEKEGYNVKGVALSGIATQNLQQSSGIKSRTTASLFYSWDKGTSNLTSKDVLVIDEAGMLGSRQMEKIIKEAQDKNAKVVLVGDWQQLQSIDAGAAFRAIAENNHYIELKEVRRQENSWAREATMLLAKGQVGEALVRYKEHDHLHHYDTQTQAKESLIQQWNDVRHTNPQKTQLIMAYTRSDVKELNKLAREQKEKDGELGTGYSFEMNNGERQFASGDRVYFLKRDDALGVINGTLGTIEKIENERGQIHIKLDSNDALSKEQRQVVVDTKEYKHLDHGYAATVYKAQGVTVDRSYLLTSKHYDAHSSYVGMSRHKESCDVFSSREQFRSEQELVQRLGRSKIKDTTLDYKNIKNTEHSATVGSEYAVRRDIEPDAQLDSLLSLHQRFESKAHVYEKQMKIVFAEKFKQEKEQFWRQANKFIAKFQDKQPELAREINEQLVPEHEAQALEYVKKFKAYSYHKEKLRPEERREFTKLTKEMMSSKLVMNHISSKEPELAKQIKQTFKEQERTIKYERSYSRGFGF